MQPLSYEAYAQSTDCRQYLASELFRAAADSFDQVLSLSLTLISLSLSLISLAHSLFLSFSLSLSLSFTSLLVSLPHSGH